MNTYVTGSTIRQLREAKGLTQAELAGTLSVSAKTISKWSLPPLPFFLQREIGKIRFQS